MVRLGTKSMEQGVKSAGEFRIADFEFRILYAFVALIGFVALPRSLTSDF
jgi:hypothetical protein